MRRRKLGHKTIPAEPRQTLATLIISSATVPRNGDTEERSSLHTKREIASGRIALAMMW